MVALLPPWGCGALPGGSAPRWVLSEYEEVDVGVLFVFGEVSVGAVFDGYCFDWDPCVVAIDLLAVVLDFGIAFGEGFGGAMFVAADVFKGGLGGWGNESVGGFVHG